MSSSAHAGAAAGQALGGHMQQVAGDGQTAEHEQTQAASTLDEQAAEHAQALDAVLDDIETSLKGNAQEYVSGFVQQGGQ